MFDIKTKIFEEIKDKELKPKSLGLTFRCAESYYYEYIKTILPQKKIKSEGTIEYIKEFDKCIIEFENIENTKRNILVFTNLVDEDIYVGSMFNAIRDNETGEVLSNINVKIKGIIHEWLLLPYKCITKYHKGICLLEFQGDVPDIINCMKEYNNNDSNIKFKGIDLINVG